jgi:hypothetical protein
MKVIIETIPHSEQRYPTVGDWRWVKEDTLAISVTEMADWRHVLLVAVHELVEAGLCKDAGITQEEVDKFDIDFEAHREEGNEDEPGDDPKAPYQREHGFATAVERMMAAEMLVNWKEYEQALNAVE